MKHKFSFGWALLTVVSALFATSCNDKVWEKLDELDGRVSKLEQWQSQVNTQITSLKALAEAWENGTTITSVNATATGWTITLSSGQILELTNGKDGKDGKDGAAGATGATGATGAAGHTPVIGVKEDGGVLYWTVDGEWLLNNGQKVPVTGGKGEQGENGSAGPAGPAGPQGPDGPQGPAGNDGNDGVTPQLRINEDTYNWEVSYDEGESWEELLVNGEPVSAKGDKGDKGENGDSFFQDVVVDDDAGLVHITLANGTTFDIPLAAYRVLYFSNPGKQLDYDLDEDGFFTGLRSTTVICNLPEEEVSAVMAQLLYPDENGDIVTRAAEKKVRIEIPDEWDGTFKVYIDVQETLKAILEVRVAAMDGTEYVAARQLDTTPLIEYVEYSAGETVYAPNTFSAEVKLNFIDGIEKVKRVAIAALPTVTVAGSYEGYGDGTFFTRNAQICFDYFEKGTDLDPYIAIPYYVFQGEDLKLDSDGYLHVDEDKLIFYANMIDGEYVRQAEVPHFRPGVNYTVATYVEYTDGGFDKINTSWDVPELVYNGKVTPVFTQDPKFEGSIASATVTADGASKLATFVVADDGAFDENRLGIYLGNYNNRFHAYDGDEKTFSITKVGNIDKYTFVAVAIDEDGKIGNPVTKDVTYSVAYGDGPKITLAEVEKPTKLDWMKVTITAADADEVRFLVWSKEEWMAKDDRGSRQQSVEKLEGFFDNFKDHLMTNTFKKSGDKWISRYEDGIALSSIETKGGTTWDTSGTEDKEIEVPATGGGKFYIFFHALKDGVHGNIYALCGDANEEDPAQLIDITELGYEAFAEAEDTYAYTSILKENLEEGGGDGGDVDPSLWEGEINDFSFFWMQKKWQIKASYANPSIPKLWVIKADNSANLDQWKEWIKDLNTYSSLIQSEGWKLLLPYFSDFAETQQPSSYICEFSGVTTAYSTYDYPDCAEGDVYFAVAQDANGNLAAKIGVIKENVTLTSYNLPLALMP